MILQLTNDTKSYSFEVNDLNYGEKLYYNFQIPTAEMEDGKYNMVLIDDNDVVVAEDVVCIGDFNSETIQYQRAENVYINTTLDANIEDVKEELIDNFETTIYPNDGYDAMKAVVVNAQPVYDNGYNDGETDQKAKLTGITITENGVFTREDGYNEITVDVPDLNGDYNEGYDAGKVDGYDSGYTAGIDYASENAEEIVAANAIDLVATKFATYYTKYSDNIVNPNPITGIYPDGETFHNLANITNNVYNTGIMPNETTKLEFWFKRDNSKENWANVIAASEKDNNSFRIRQYAVGNEDEYVAQLKNSTINFNITSSIWYHIEMSYADGLIVNGEKVGDFTQNISQYTTAPIFINGGQLWTLPDGTDDGEFGMIKITQDGITNVIIPTEDGLKNITTDEMLELVYNEGTYQYINNDSIILDNLIKSVDVQPKIDVFEYKIKMGYSSFVEVPYFYDFSNVSDLSNMFANCNNLTKLPNGINGNIVTNWNGFMAYTNITSIEPIDTSLCKNLDGMFSNTKLTEIPYLNTSNATTMVNFLANNGAISTIPELDTRRVENMNSFFNNFSGNKNLVSLPKIYCDSCNNMGSYFAYYADAMSNLTEVGGWINLKCNWDDRYGLPSCNNLTYQSCINILNGLYDFVLNGETPTSSQGKLKVHPNFLTTVGDEISIGTNKGWTITA